MNLREQIQDAIMATVSLDGAGEISGLDRGKLGDLLVQIFDAQALASEAANATVTEQVIKGYTAQAAAKVALVNAFKEDEERLLRKLDELYNDRIREIDPRWLAIARTHINEGFMALNRAVFQPTRIRLPEDGE